MELLAFCLVVIWLVRRSKRRKRQRITTSNFQNQNSNAGVVSVPLLAPNLNQALGDGWFPDPTGRYVMRYWNGQNWTEWVSSNDGRSKSDPIITKISQRGANVGNSGTTQFVAPQPESVMNGPDLNELRRRFNS